MQRSSTSPDEFLAGLSGEVAATMRQVDELVVDAMPGRSRTLWEGVFWGGTEQTIIGYGDIVQPRPRGERVEWFLVGLARQSKHYSLYVNAVADGTYLGKQYDGRLGKVKVGAANLTFTKLEDVDLGALSELLGRAHELTAPDERVDTDPSG